MELKVTVDLDDLEIGDYYDEGSLTLSEVIKQEIIQETVSRIKELILNRYYDKIQEATEKKISEMTEKILEDFKNSDEKFMYRPQRDKDPVETTFKEFVAKHFTESVESSNVSRNMKRFVKNMKELNPCADDRSAKQIQLITP